MQQTIVDEKIAIMEGVVASRSSDKDQTKSENLEITSRFGVIAIQPEKAICFPHGMPGMPSAVSFCLTKLPNIKNEQFKLLQCVNDHALSFIVIPSTYDNQLIEECDIEDACSVLGINKNNLLLLFIVTVHETGTGRRLSVNAKAPLFIDAVSRTATQYIFQNNNYEIQHFIS